jgi:hypothetical protein
MPCPRWYFIFLYYSLFVTFLLRKFYLVAKGTKGGPVPLLMLQSSLYGALFARDMCSVYTKIIGQPYKQLCKELARPITLPVARHADIQSMK